MFSGRCFRLAKQKLLKNPVETQTVSTLKIGVNIRVEGVVDATSSDFPLHPAGRDNKNLSFRRLCFQTVRLKIPLSASNIPLNHADEEIECPIELTRTPIH